MARRRSPARWLAPLALVACAAVIYAVVSASPVVDKNAKAARTTTTASAGTTTTSTTARSRKASRRRTYTVRRGDVLSAIAERYGVTVSRLQELNPDIDPSALRVGAKLRLRR